MTQFVRGALTRARKAGATILFVTCDPKTELQTFVDLTIAPAVGPEVIAGSTRLKAGTATKLVLNMLTTAAMVRTGKTYGNLMVDVRSGSEKLKDRARRMVNIITGLDYDAADALLQEGEVEREGRRRHAEDRAAAREGRRRASGRPTASCARRLARTSRRTCASCWACVLDRLPRRAPASTPPPGPASPRPRRAVAAAMRAPASSPVPPPSP